MKKTLAMLGIAVAVGFAAPARAADITSLSDNFDGESVGIPASSLLNFLITGGSVDVIGSGSGYDFLSGNGRYLDLCGTGSNVCSTLQSVSAFAAGTYKVVLDLAGNQRGLEDLTTTVSLGGASNSLTLSASQGITQLILYATIASNQYLTISNSASSNANIGNLLMSVQVSQVPGPVAGAGLPALMALAGYGLMRRRKGA